jgi:chromate reductase
MKKKIFAINGSASKHSSNLFLIHWIIERTKGDFEWRICERLSALPHFDPELSVSDTPAQIVTFRENILNADAVLVCSPEYVFSIPSGLKNAIEWCVSTTVFSGKPLGVITASAQGEKGQEELKLILKTVEGKFNNDTTLLIQGIKGKIDREGNVTDARTVLELERFISAFRKLIEE